jgi:hypothetical protein
MLQYNLSLVAHAQLAATLSDSGTTLQVMPGQGAAFTQPPAIGVLARSRAYRDLAVAEHVKLVSRSTDIITIERGIIGTPQEWPTGTLLLGYWSPALLDQVFNNLDALEYTLNLTVGGGKQNVVFKRTGKDFAASAGSGLSVNVTSGSAFANYKLVTTLTTTNLAFTAPASATRIDLIQANALKQTVEVKLGTEGGSAPSADTDCIGLWQVTTTVGQATRISGDLADVRVY